MYLPIEEHVKRIEDDEIYTVTITYYYNATVGMYMYALGGRKLSYAGCIPAYEMRRFIESLGYISSEAVREFSGRELKDLLWRVGIYIGYYGT